MQWICYIAGQSRKGDNIIVHIGLAEDPLKYTADLGLYQPYKLNLLGCEMGTPELLEERREAYKTPFQNGWYKPSEELMAHIKGLPTPDYSKAGTKKICVDFTSQEAAHIEQGAKISGAKTKTRLIRRAVKFYLALWAYKNKGWTVQVIKGGKFHAFENLDDIEPPQ